MKKLLVALVSGLAALVACELLHRAWLAGRGTPYDAEATRQRLEELLDPAARYLPAATEPGPEAFETASVLHPYTGAEAGHDTGGVLAYFREQRTEADYAVVVVGGSVAASWVGAFGADLEQRVQACPQLAGRQVRLLNYAHAAYKQPQQVLRLAYLLSLGYRPDAVINLDGFNEVGLGFNNALDRIHPVYPSPPIWNRLILNMNRIDREQLETLARLFDLRQRAQRMVSRTLGWNLHLSSVLGRTAVARMARLGEQSAALQEHLELPSQQGGSAPDRARSGPDFEQDLDSVFELIATNWTESSRSLHALCSSRGIEYLHVLQPALLDRGSKPRSAEELAYQIPKGWSRGARRGYPLLRARIPGLRAEGIEVLDASLLFEQEPATLYIDACHYGPRGEALLNETIVAALLDLLNR